MQGLAMLAQQVLAEDPFNGALYASSAHFLAEYSGYATGYKVQRRLLLRRGSSGAVNAAASSSTPLRPSADSRPTHEWPDPVGVTQLDAKLAVYASSLACVPPSSFRSIPPFLDVLNLLQ